MMLAALRQITARLRALIRGGDLDRDFAQELETHLEMLTADNIRRGLAPEEARRQAALRIGAASALQVQHRDARGFRVVEDLAQDLRFAGRLMLRERWFSAAAILAIALGIGANTVGFSIINASFIRSFDFDRADQIFAISWRSTGRGRVAASALDLDDWRSQSRSFAAIGASSFGAINISDDHAAPEQTQGSRVTANLFDVLHQRPLLGRTFTAGEDRPGAEPVVIISHDLWNRRFDRDPRVVGRILKINGSPATIIGVMPEGMEFGENSGSKLWTPFIPTEAQLTREVRVLNLFGRVRDGVTKQQAATEIDAIAQRIIKDHPDQSKNVRGGLVETLNERYLNGIAPRMFVVIMTAVIFVLLIACANVANLLMSRAMYRSREVAVRYALGATRWRIVRQLLIESVTLSTLGGIAGLAIAFYALRAFDAAIHATDAPWWLRFNVDYRVLFYVAAICIVTGVTFGIAPALQVSRENPGDTLKDGARGTAGNRRSGRLGTIMVVAELALTVVLLSGAGLMLRSFIALYATPTGFDVNGLTRMRMQLPPANYPTPDSRRRFFEQLMSKVDAVPGLQSAALTTAVPPRNQEFWRVVTDRSEAGDDNQRPYVGTVKVSPRYFEALGVGVVRGRDFDASDSVPGAATVVINQMMADRHFPGQDPLGRQLRFVPRPDDGALLAGDAAFAKPWRTIVGVVPTFQQGNDDDAFRDPIVYLPLLQAPDRTASLMIRSSLPPDLVMAGVRAAIQSIDVDQPVLSIETLEQVIAGERAIFRIFSTLFGLLAAIGLTLSAVGIYGVIAYAVTQRTQEIGVRVAIGASRWDVSWLFLRRGLMQIGLALAIGIPIAIGLGRVARIPLVQIEANDPLTMIAIAAMLSAVALVACVVPARKAARVDPIIALRSE